MFTLSLFILTLLALATIIVRVKISRNNSPELTANKKRIQAWWVICIICMPIFYLGGWALTLLLYALIYWAAFEFSRLQNIRINFMRILLLSLTIIGYHFMIEHYQNLSRIFFVLPILLLIVSILASTLTNVRNTLLLFFCVTSLLSLQLISQFSIKVGYDSSLIILFIFFITSANDIIQYLCGKLLGRTKLAPTLSPNKTIEGALGGMCVTGVIFALILPYIITVAWDTALLIGVVISMLGIMGDLHFSFFKRLAKVKNTGSSIPGHGGILDRIDSLTLTAPGFGLCLSLVN